MEEEDSSPGTPTEKDDTPHPVLFDMEPAATLADDGRVRFVARCEFGTMWTVHANTEAEAILNGGKFSDGVHWWPPEFDAMMGPACPKCGRRYCKLLLDGGNYLCDREDCKAVWHRCGNGQVVYNCPGPEFCIDCTEKSRSAIRAWSAIGAGPERHCRVCNCMAAGRSFDFKYSA